MARKIVAISGPFALADDGTGWQWTDAGWIPWGRGTLPPETPEEFQARIASGKENYDRLYPPETRMTGRDLIATTGDPFVDKASKSEHEVAAVPPKRGPGRPRKVQP
jgi:hypothetical protein